MQRVEKTVFISYRRTNAPWALAIYQNLTARGYDVFLDYTGIASGDFERVILENIKARAHFLVLLTPSALERCAEPGDWLRREIETALETRRNFVPLMLEGFDFATPSIARHLTGKLEGVKRYNALRVPVEYFDEAMSRLCEKYLNVPLTAVLHPLPDATRQAVKEQQAAAGAAPAVEERQLTAHEWFEQGYRSDSSDEQIRCYTEAIRLKPDFAVAYNNRGNTRNAQGDLAGAIQDYDQAILLKSDEPLTYRNRGLVRHARGDLAGAIQDYDRAIQLDAGYAEAYNSRGVTRFARGDRAGAMRDLDEAIRLMPGCIEAYYNRGVARAARNDLAGAIGDYTEAIRLNPDYAKAYYNRAGVWHQKGDVSAAIKDYRKYLDLGGEGDSRANSALRDWLRHLETKLAARK